MKGKHVFFLFYLLKWALRKVEYKHNKLYNAVEVKIQALHSAKLAAEREAFNASRMISKIDEFLE